MASFVQGFLQDFELQSLECKYRDPPLQSAEGLLFSINLLEKARENTEGPNIFPAMEIKSPNSLGLRRYHRRRLAVCKTPPSSQRCTAWKGAKCKTKVSQLLTGALP